MSRYDSSLQSQNPISQAQNAVERAHHAVSQAMTHPSDQAVQQAEQALEHADRAFIQAGDSNNEPAVELVAEMLAEEHERITSLVQSDQWENRQE